MGYTLGLPKMLISTKRDKYSIHLGYQIGDIEEDSVIDYEGTDKDLIGLIKGLLYVQRLSYNDVSIEDIKYGRYGNNIVNEESKGLIEKALSWIDYNLYELNNIVFKLYKVDLRYYNEKGLEYTVGIGKLL